MKNLKKKKIKDGGVMMNDLFKKKLYQKTIETIKGQIEFILYKNKSLVFGEAFDEFSTNFCYFVSKIQAKQKIQLKGSYGVLFILL